MPDRKNVLIAPLDWGLGHATRCIPIVRVLLELNHNVSIATSGHALALLKIEFPDLRYYQLSSYRAAYSRWLPFMIKIFVQAPKFLSVIFREHRQIQKIITSENFDLIISDNRYGCYSEKVKSIFITHQVNILMPLYLAWAGFFVNAINKKLMKRFVRVWIPDDPALKLTGKLVPPDWIDFTYIGLLSRFDRVVRQPALYQFAAIISGPEPQRTVFESKIKAEFQKLTLPSLIVRGIPVQKDCHQDGKVKIVGHLNASEMAEAISKSEMVIARSGYSTVMDLFALGGKAVFVPTPGQTEQEYLAGSLSEKRIAPFQKQSEFDLNTAIELAKFCKGFDGQKRDPNLLLNALKEVLK